jgi:hypothetical protein
MTTPEPPPKEPLDDDEDDEKTRTIADGSPARWAREHSFNHTARRPPNVAPDSTYRVALLGFSLCSDKLPGVLDHAYARAFADHPGPRIALHAGVAYGPGRGAQGRSGPRGDRPVRGQAGRRDARVQGVRAWPRLVADRDPPALRQLGAGRRGSRHGGRPRRGLRAPVESAQSISADCAWACSCAARTTY